MPRRSRKRSTQDKKAALVFAESPVNNQWNIPSPVSCAHHPLTANAIPVEDWDKSTWVSPQFEAVPRTVTGSRRTLRRRKSLHSNLPCTCGVSVVNGDNRPVNNKFKPLKFLGDKSAVVTVLEDISVDKSDSENLPENRIISPESDEDTTLRRKVRKKSVNSRDIHGQQGNSSVSDKSNANTNRAGDKEDVNVSDLSINDCNVKAPVQKLFCEEPLSTSLQYNLNTPHLINKSQSKTDCMTLSPVQEVTKKSRAYNYGNEYSSRLRPRFLLESTLCSTPSDSRKRTTVLVPDTPEAEYGIPARLRKSRLKIKC